MLFIKAEIRQNSGEKEGKTGGFTTDYTDSHRFINLIISKIESVSICVICGEHIKMILNI